METGEGLSNVRDVNNKTWQARKPPPYKILCSTASRKTGQRLVTFNPFYMIDRGCENLTIQDRYNMIYTIRQEKQFCIGLEILQFL